ncbi:dephospho-CoA kinase [Phycicoccus badiiscoriae]|uniref:Dephospho-CoA kinase n=1 Tax=Pedococcus badiiscoriae TaxID=642776 RepID=A0A852WHL0_9MICO|nr:dephospho-CoA kinase [Pedococcus badiiscoriae]NYG08360.1 dephospho-CoA kinase [Pedococcus badiiscoriae]
MLRVGLTGGIGSGKSTVAQRFSELGAVVIDADRLAREVVAAGSPGLEAVVARFGEGVLDDAGALNRAALGAVVFADEQARRDLEGITHPLIARRTAELVAAAPDDAIVVHDVPLLVEKDYGPGYHLVLVVGADEQTRTKRLTRTRGMTESDARSRIAAQATDPQRRTAADVWLQNDGAKDDLLAAVDDLWHARLVPFEDNVRRGIRAPRAEELVLVPHDPTWSAQANRLLARLRLAFGDALVTADHVGSTAVPGLLAKDVIDLQVGVRSLADADDPGLVERLTRAGFPRPGGQWADNGKDGTAWPKRFHGTADPGRPANLHVREVASPGWRWALMFRDWLRAEPGASEEYAGLKGRLAATGLTSSEYADAKEPWFDGIHDSAEDWALRTGWEPSGG